MSTEPKTGQVRKTQLRKMLLRWRQLDEATARARLADALLGRRGSPLWARLLMSLTGRSDCGNYSPPEPRAIFYDKETIQGRGSWRDIYRTSDSHEVWGDGVPERYWAMLNVQDDGFTLIPGNSADGGRQGGQEYSVPPPFSPEWYTLPGEARR